MTTTVIIPNSDNKANSLPNLFNIIMYSANLKIDNLQNLVTDFREGKDLSFNIPNDILPNFLRQLSDSGFIYKPVNLKKIESDHLASSNSYSRIIIQDNIVEISGIVTQTRKETFSIIISDTNLNDEEKKILKNSIENILQTIAKDTIKCDIDIKTVKHDFSKMSTESLINAGHKWTTQHFKL